MPAMSLPVRAPGRVRVWASFVRFEHTLFSLPLLLAGAFSARGPALPAARWALIAVAAVGARTAAMAINRIVDRRLDALNPRTRTRELPSGRMALPEALALLAASTLAYVLACAALGPWYLRVAIVPLAVFTLYPWLKRVTPLCHFGVGAALALAPLAGFAAAHPDLAHPAAAWWLAGFALVWVSGFDIIYATLDETFDRAHGVHSLVARLGRRRALGVSAALHLLAFVCVAVALVQLSRTATAPRALVDTVVALALGVIAALLSLEQRWAEHVDLAFFKVNVWVGAAVLAGVLGVRALGGL